MNFDELRKMAFLALERGPDGVFWLDESGTFLHVNETGARYLRTTPEALVGTNVRSIMRQPTEQQWTEYFRRLTNGETLEIDELALREDRGTFPVEVRAWQVNEAGRALILALLRDISEKKSLEAQLLHSQKMEALGRLAGGVVHDFNNLLTALNGYTDLALGSVPENTPLAEDLGEMRRILDSGTELIQQLRAFGSREECEMRTVDLNHVVRNLEKMLRRLLGEGVTVSTCLDADPATIRADSGQIGQVLVNLAVNARDAMEGRGRLVVETRNMVLDEACARRHPGAEPGEYIQIAVTDTGCGMTDEVRTRIFEPFFTTKKAQGGTGLGLATTFGIIRRHGGTIWAYSEPDKGTTFKVFFPLLRDGDDADTDSEAGNAPPAPAAGGETVLIVEDDQYLRLMFKEMLGREGYNVVLAAHPDEAEAWAARNTEAIHLVIADVVLPGRNGRELVERLARKRPNLRVLYMSGYANRAIQHLGVLEPGMDFIQKPFSREELLAKVREILDQ
ncbi:MAG: response regulator [Kiritimatiellaeota bacterium]|nr:response regulator [Kiritimatiellota bacterium]